MSEKVIYNCYNHTFTHENVPNGNSPLYLVPLSRIKPFRFIMRARIIVHTHKTWV